MEEQEFQYYLGLLKWSMPENAQEEAVNYFSNKIEDKYISRLIQDTDKDTWGNSMKIIRSLGKDRAIIAIQWLLYLLKDLNWPGASESIEVIKQFDTNELIPFIDTVLDQADLEEDSMWIYGIKELIGRLGIEQSVLSNKVVLKKARA
ncbi:hypothetical protein BC351_35475 [Paenibacillus ferrarius]|uniref:DUF5071 domain-containing protein n=1 Tax=Paenibacillus ferrarius TaxID=1469647 RepID=A0A1V4HDS4_9BACL|nr:DUF5071 domain-containing protein [Paenibacillus ferrarius]OPH51156.1 hypothetical protein BC351_35475 [Paenibacillus ferrarius]